ncbi:MAG: serine hydrolase domain-containing protein [Nocardioidaceae bacterium]
MPDLSEQTTLALRRILHERQSDGRVPGLFGGVVRDGGLAWGEGVGRGDLDDPSSTPSADSQFLIASNTKTFTAVLVMQLRDENKLSLDDTLDKFVPDAGHPGITIRQMLSHASGMQREPVGDIWETLENPSREELIEGFGQAERILKPHYRWHYSNLVFAMLGEVVARLDGRDWYDALTARILQPLEMKRTTLGLSGSAVTGYFVPPFSDVPVKEPLLDLRALAACGGLASTGADLAKWSSFVADPVDEVLHGDTFEEMIQPQILADADGWTAAYGLGFGLVRSGDKVFIGHTGGMPGHITGLYTHRESRTGGMVLMNNSAPPDPAEVAITLASYVIDNDPALPKLWEPGRDVPAELVGTLGRWFTEGNGVTFSLRKGRLEARMDGAPSDKPPSVFVQVGTDVYRTESGREMGEVLRVTRDADGTVTKMNWATYLVTREPFAFGEWLNDE